MQIKGGGEGNPILSIWKANFQGGGGRGAINPKLVKRVKGVTTRMDVHST